MRLAATILLSHIASLVTPQESVDRNIDERLHVVGGDHADANAPLHASQGTNLVNAGPVRDVGN